MTPHRPSALLLWEADVPNHVEDVSSSVEAKINALLAHESQYASTMGIVAEDSTETTTALERFESEIRMQLETHGAVGGVAMGESFHLMTDI